MKNSNTLLMSCVLASLFTASAFAQDTKEAAAVAEAQPAPAALSWAEMDKDSNGSLSKDEATANKSLAEIFDQADGDANGQLSGDEYRSYLAANPSVQTSKK
ncbi:EF-hand domain-containing protein [Arenimonas sp.]|uniref:EF-hand domain-containing protein n=1 Tax=Arenimonas sp. TaxID=1872635 RepID=UPI0039E4B7D0